MAHGTWAHKQTIVDCAAANFPIGLSSSGTPTSLSIVGLPGYDQTLLSLLLATEKLFGDFPAPPNPSLCAGCLSNVTVREVSRWALRAAAVLCWLCQQCHGLSDRMSQSVRHGLQKYIIKLSTLL